MGLIIALSTLSSSLILSTKLFLFEILPSIYFQMFTPLHLFFLLNLLILSILALTHRCKDAVQPSLAAPHRSSSSSDHRLPRLRAKYADNEAKLFSGIIISDHDAAAEHEAELTVKRRLAAETSAILRPDQLHRRGDRVVNEANTSYSVHSDEISAEILVAQPTKVYNAVLRNRCSYGRTVNDPDLHHNGEIINDVISVVEAAEQNENADDEPPERKKLDKPAGNLQDQQAIMIKEEISEIQMGETDEQKADFCTHKPEENVEAGAHARRMGSADDHLLISSLDSGLKLAKEEQERPLASTRFTSKKTANKTHLDIVRSNSPLKISRPTIKRGDTIDATWKAICENKSRHSSHLTRQHRTSYTKKVYHHISGHNIGDPNVTNEPLLSPSSPSNKQRHHTPTTRSSSGLLRKREHSIPRDELNARVESFISRFHQQIRIQREESLLSYTNMVARGTD